MNSKSTWVWLTIAVVLGAAIFGIDKFGRKPAPELVALIPGFRAADVTSVQFTPAGQLEIRANRTNGLWRLAKPVNCPAQAANIEALISALEKIAPAHTIAGDEVRQRKNSDAEFGFDSRTTLILNRGEQSQQLRIGARTAPGDQLYVQVVGSDGVAVVDAQLLKLLPGKTDDWRDTGLVDLRGLVFDRIVVSNTAAVIELQRDPTNLLWRLTRPMQARADNFRLAEAVQKLHGTRVKSFVTDDPRADAESYGFHNPELELSLVAGTNTLAGIQFGKSPTNDSTLIYARRIGFDSIVTVERQPIESWLVAVNQFRDPHLITLLSAPEEIVIRDAEPFKLQRAGTNGWRLADSDMPVDSELVQAVILTLTRGRITQFKDSITEADLTTFGLVKPRRQIVIRTAVKTSGATNGNAIELSFGDIKDGNIFVRRADENPVYAIGVEDYARLAISDWQLRARAVWRFTEHDVARITVQHGALKTELRHAGTNSWSFAPGSQGIINNGAVEEAVKRLGLLDASAWIARGDAEAADYGFGATNLTVSVELKDGTRHSVEFGGKSVDNYPYARVRIGEQNWIFEFPIIVSELLTFAIPLPAGKP